jgi:hypothetical protein
MSEQLDNELRDHIRQVFNDYEDDTAADGWRLLRKKFPAKAKRRAAAYWWSSAALILALLGFGLWLRSSKIKSTKIASHRINSSQKFDGRNSTAARKFVMQNNPSSPITKGSAVPRRRAIEHDGKSDGYAMATSSKAGTDGRTINNRAIEHEALTALPTVSLTQRFSPDALSSNLDATVIPALKSPFVATTGQSDESKREAALLALLENDQRKEATKPPAVIKEKNKVLFGVYTATYFNYSKGSSDQLNIGGGISSDIKISSNFKLSTGIAVTQNTLSFSNSLPTATASGNFTTLAAKNLSFATAFNVSANSTPVFVSTNFKNFNASLIGIDIPVNIKYVISPARSDAFFSAGISSGTFASETYQYKYNYPYQLAADAQQVSSHSSFSNFALANSLNFSFGTGYQLGRNKRLIFEPFFKYPLNGLGEQQIKFGSGGINLKLNFQSDKK